MLYLILNMPLLIYINILKYVIMVTALEVLRYWLVLEIYLDIFLLTEMWEWKSMIYNKN